MSTENNSKKKPLTANESLVLQCMKHWWWSIVKNFKKGKRTGRIDTQFGAPITRLPGTDVRQWLKKHRNVELSPKQVRTATAGLVEKGYALRFKEWTCGWNQSYSYAPPATEIRTYNPDMVGTTDLPTPDYNTNYQQVAKPVENSSEGQKIPSTEAVCTVSTGHIEAPSTPLLSESSAVSSSVSSSETPDRCAASEPIDHGTPSPVPQVDPPRQVKDRRSVEPPRRPHKDKIPTAALIALNKAKDAGFTFEPAKRVFRLGATGITKTVAQIATIFGERYGCTENTLWQAVDHLIPI